MIDTTADPPRSGGRSGRASFRLPIEWGWAEPVEGQYDEAAFDRYVNVCRAGRARGLEPVIELQHGDLPAWLGADFWLGLDAPARFGAWAAVVIDRLGDHCRRLVTLVEPNVVAWRGWMTGAASPFRVGAVGDLVRAVDHMAAAHVVSHAAAHAARPDAVASLEIHPMPVYELDGLIVDVLTARTHGVGRYDLGPWLIERRRDWYQKRPPPSSAGSVLRRLARSAIPLEQALPRTVVAVFTGAHERPVD